MASIFSHGKSSKLAAVLMKLHNAADSNAPSPQSVSDLLGPNDGPETGSIASPASNVQTSESVSPSGDVVSSNSNEISNHNIDNTEIRSDVSPAESNTENLPEPIVLLPNSTTGANEILSENLDSLPSKGRSSRRKPQKTRKVIENEDLVDDMLFNAMKPEEDDNPIVESEHMDGTSNRSSPHLINEMEINNDSSDVKPSAEDIDENFELPEGTIMVQPESVDVSPKVHELDSSVRPRKIFKGGNLDTAILHCTACNKQLGVDGVMDVHRHPVLKVLICKKCFTWYSNADIEQDAEGSDEQCRWCGQGGDLVCCDFCHNALCKGCIRRNLGRKELNSILDAGDDSKWKCYICDPKPLLNLIEHCTGVMEAMAKQEKKQQEAENRRRKFEITKGRAAQQVSVIQSSTATVAGRSGIIKASNPPAQQRPARSFQEQMHSIRMAQSNNSRTLFSGPRGIGVQNAVRPGQLRSGDQLFIALTQGGAAVKDSGLNLTLERLLSATNSMHMFLTSLNDDLRRSGSKVSSSSSVSSKRREVASKLWQAHMAYGKSFREAAGWQRDPFYQKQTPPRSQSKPQVSKSVAGNNNVVEVIELSDDEDENKLNDISQKISKKAGSLLAAAMDRANSMGPRKRKNPDDMPLVTKQRRQDSGAGYEKLEGFQVWKHGLDTLEGGVEEILSEKSNDGESLSSDQNNLNMVCDEADEGEDNLHMICDVSEDELVKEDPEEISSKDAVQSDAESVSSQKSVDIDDVADEWTSPMQTSEKDVFSEEQQASSSTSADKVGTDLNEMSASDCVESPVCQISSTEKSVTDETPREVEENGVVESESMAAESFSLGVCHADQSKQDDPSSPRKSESSCKDDEASESTNAPSSPSRDAVHPENRNNCENLTESDGGHSDMDEHTVISSGLDTLIGPAVPVTLSNQPQAVDS